jgi:hypothetical protein
MNNQYEQLSKQVCGLTIIESMNMTEDGNPVEVSRTWKERLFSRPWRPLKKTYSYIPQIPRTDILIMGNKAVMHPMVARQLKSDIRLKDIKP